MFAEPQHIVSQFRYTEDPRGTAPSKPPRKGTVGMKLYTGIRAHAPASS
jgi:hypothetical protein